MRIECMCEHHSLELEALVSLTMLESSLIVSVKYLVLQPHSVLLQILIDEPNTGILAG